MVEVHPAVEVVAQGLPPLLGEEVEVEVHQEAVVEAHPAVVAAQKQQVAVQQLEAKQEEPEEVAL